MEQSKTQIWHKFRHFIVGISVLLFGILIGGVGVASAGIGIGIPMIPLGIYLCVRGWHIFKQENNDQTDETPAPQPTKTFEETKLGKLSLGVLCVLIGIGTSALFIGIPILILGIWLIYKASNSNVKKLTSK